MVKAKVFKYANVFDGPPKITDFELIEEDLPELADEEFLAEAVYLSVDPYMRGLAHFVQVGETYVGSQVARITASKNKDFPVGRYVVGMFGWRSHTIYKGVDIDFPVKLKPNLLPEMRDLPLSLGLGALGMPGASAYFGFLEIIDPKPGDTLVVSGAAGAVGSLVGQIGKIKGLKVIGITGSDHKGKWITEQLGFDYFINYKSDDIAKKLQQFAPDGIDCFFDNVAGDVGAAVLLNMKRHGRISICGAISTYNGDKLKASIDQNVVLLNELRIEGFTVNRWADRLMEAMTQILKWIEEGKLKFKETVTDGFENMPRAFIDLMNGANMGKAVVKA